MKRAVIFAHFDKQNEIDDYVIYYLKALKEVASDIIFVSGSGVKNPEKLDGLVSHIIAEPHNEYDFGSYKRGFEFLESKLDDFDELVFANDSCFGPFYSLTKIFDEMEGRDCDFWGITKNKFGIKIYLKLFYRVQPHIQSYFVVLKKNIFTTQYFKDFIKSVVHQKSKNLIISKYEIGLTEFLVKNGFKYDSYVKTYENINNISILKWRQIVLYHKMPFIKCSVLKLLNRDLTTIAGWQEVVSEVSDYPIELIENNLERLECDKIRQSSVPVWLKRLFFDSIAGLPLIFRKFFEYIASLFFPILKD